MRQTTVPDSKTKATLIGVTEELLAEIGFDAISVRDITGKAGANVAAVNYHFGGRDGLLGLIAQRHVVAVSEARVTRLDAIRRRGGTPQVEEVVEAWVEPLIAQARNGELPERVMLKLLGRLFGERSRNLPQVAEESHRQAIVYFIQTLETALPSLGSERLAWNVHFLSGSLAHMLAQSEGVEWLVGAAAGVDDQVRRLVGFVSAGLRAGLAGEAPRQVAAKDASKEEISRVEPKLEVTVDVYEQAEVMVVDEEPVTQASPVAEQTPQEEPAKVATQPKKAKKPSPTPQPEFLF